MSQKYFYFDQNLCYGCDACRVACKDWNDLKPGKVAYRKRITVETGAYPDITISHALFACCHCEQPACIEVCPVGAIKKRESDGAVTVNRDICVGCRACKGACPYDAPQFEDEDGSKMQKCTMCWDRLDEDTWVETRKIPVCVGACPQRALKFGTLEELASQGVTEFETDITGFKYDKDVKPAMRFKRKYTR